MRKRLNAAIIVVALIMAIVSAAVLYDLYGIISMPREFLIIEGEEQALDFRLPLNIYATGEEDGIIKLNGSSITTRGVNVKGSCPLLIQTTAKGNTQIEFRLFGVIPLKRMTVTVISPVKVVPGGNSIGVKLYTQGVLVVAVAEVTAIDGRVYNPAVQAGIAVGDSIIAINNTKIRDAEHVISLLSDSQGKDISVVVKRGKDTFTKKVKPVKSQEDGKYRIGAWVRDKTAGVGTLSFYYPQTGVFGALGHPITDVDTGLLLSVEEGEILESKVASIQRGERSKPGEIRGIFFEEENKLGIIERNTEFGIYGVLNRPLQNPYYDQAIPIALHQQVREGPAKILTTVDDRVEMYDVEIQKIARQPYPEPKSMVVKVVDKGLLEKTGGIVQGMSGSPIIQDDRLVGVITHVFVNDPTKGYGIFAEWMMLQAGLNDREGAKQVDITG